MNDVHHRVRLKSFERLERTGLTQQQRDADLTFRRWAESGSFSIYA